MTSFVFYPQLLRQDSKHCRLILPFSGLLSDFCLLLDLGFSLFTSQQICGTSTVHISLSIYIVSMEKGGVQEHSISLPPLVSSFKDIRGREARLGIFFHSVTLTIKLNALHANESFFSSIFSRYPYSSYFSHMSRCANN